MYIEDVVLDEDGAAAEEDARGEVDGTLGGGVADEEVWVEAKGKVGGTLGGGAFGGVTGWALPAAAALGGGSTRAGFTGCEGLFNEKVETVVRGT